MMIIIMASMIFSEYFYFFQSFNLLQDHFLAINHIWKYNFLKILYILATSLRTHCKIISWKIIIIVFKLIFLLLIMMVLFMFVKWWKFTTKKLNYITDICFKFSKKLNKVYNNLKD